MKETGGFHPFFYFGLGFRVLDLGLANDILTAAHVTGRKYN